MHATSQEPAGTAGPQTAPAGWPHQGKRNDPGANGKALPGLGGSGQSRQGHARASHKRRAGGHFFGDGRKSPSSYVSAFWWAVDVRAKPMTRNACYLFDFQNPFRRGRIPLRNRLR